MRKTVVRPIDAYDKVTYMYLNTQGDTEMTWLDILRTINEEGREAAKRGANEWDNPYCFTTETAQAYAWEDGYKARKKEAA